MEKAVISDAIPVHYFKSLDIGREFISSKMQQTDEVKDLSRRNMIYEGRVFGFSGYNSDRGDCIFVRLLNEKDTLSEIVQANYNFRKSLDELSSVSISWLDHSTKDGCSKITDDIEREENKGHGIYFEEGIKSASPPLNLVLPKTSSLDVSFSRNDEIGRSFLRADIRGIEDVDNMAKNMLFFKGKPYSFSGWNSDRNECYFANIDGVKSDFSYFEMGKTKSTEIDEKQITNSNMMFAQNLKSMGFLFAMVKKDVQSGDFDLLKSRVNQLIETDSMPSANIQSRGFNQSKHQIEK